MDLSNVCNLKLYINRAIHLEREEVTQSSSGMCRCFSWELMMVFHCYRAARQIALCSPVTRLRKCTAKAVSVLKQSAR